jgi:hypothetical protein
LATAVVFPTPPLPDAMVTTFVVIIQSIPSEIGYMKILENIFQIYSSLAAKVQR